MNRASNTSYFLTRQEKLRVALRDRKLEFLTVTHLPNVFYLTGFRGSAGIAVFGQREGLLFVDPRYTLQAREQAAGVEVREAKQRLITEAGAWLRARRARVVGIEEANLTYAGWRMLEESAGKSAHFRTSGG